MGPSRRDLRSAIVMTMCLSVLSGAFPAAAQQYEASLRSLDYSPDPLARSPRLLGMGRLTLADDLHNHVNLWDFAGNPTGIAEAESLTVFEYRPGTRSSTALRDLAPATRERQQLSARQVRHGIETWKRAAGETAYGLIGEVATLQWDRPFSGAVEERGKFTVPTLGGAVNGRLPWVPSTRFDYALRVGFSLERYDDLYFDIFQLPQGEYIGKSSTAVPPPDLFTPNHVDVSNLGGGVAISMRVTPGIKAAIGYDRARARVRSKNEDLRSTSRTDERRPFDIGQASVVGRVGRHLEFGADGRAWSSASEESFFWTVSAGQGQDPLSGQGKRLDRKEDGTSLRTRARWAQGPFEFGAGLSTSFRRSVVTPWYPVKEGDAPGFNNFLDLVGFRAGADTLLLPARVKASRVTEHGYEIVGGGSWRLPGHRGSLGAEFHRWRQSIDQRFVGEGPEPIGWDVRAGGEYPCNAAFLARAGWSYGLSDRDALTAANTYRHATATTGFGYQPVGSRWSVDLGYAFEWVNPDFADPARSRETHQRLALQTRWPF
jgi:hypothetical protein